SHRFPLWFRIRSAKASLNWTPDTRSGATGRQPPPRHLDQASREASPPVISTRRATKPHHPSSRPSEPRSGERMKGPLPLLVLRTRPGDLGISPKTRLAEAKISRLRHA